MVTDLDLKGGQVFGTLREAATARKVTPPLFDMMAILGRENVIARLKAVSVFLEANG